MGNGNIQSHLAGHKHRNLINNIFWPEELAGNSGLMDHERYVSLLPMALSKTKDDKGRVRWTFFGASRHKDLKRHSGNHFMMPPARRSR